MSRIIDTHVHIGNMLDFALTEDMVLYSMDKYGINFSLVSNIEAAEYDHFGRAVPYEYQKDQNTLLRNTLRFAKAYPDKIGVLVWLKPASELPDREFERLLEENRDIIYGFKLHPYHSRVAPDSDRLEPIYALAEKFAMPVVSHTGGCEEADSIHLFNAARLHPNINFVMVHMDLGTDNTQALRLLGELPNLYGDTTWVPIGTTLEAVRRYGSEKILFGSDNPIDGRDTYLHNRTGQRSLYQEYFNEFRDIVSEEDYGNIMYKNAQRLFNIKLS